MRLYTRCLFARLPLARVWPVLLLGLSSGLALAVPPAVPGITFQTPLQNGLSISDVPGPTGGILMKTATGAILSISDVGITITNGKGATISMVGPTVDVNVGALTIT